MKDYIPWDKYVKLFEGVRITFSRNCSSGFGHCDCHRCRNERGEPVDTVTEMHAASVSANRKHELVKRRAK